MKPKRTGFMQLFLGCLMLAACTTAAASSPGQSERAGVPASILVNGQPIAGLWATTVFLDPALAPDLEGGPLMQGHMLLHPNGTAQWDTTAASGLHPVAPFARGAPTIYGTWTVVNGGIRIETSNYTSGVVGEGELRRQTFELEFPMGNGTMEGLMVADILPCEAGLLRCPSPVDVGPVEFPTGDDAEDGPPVGPVVFRRIPYPQP